MIPTSDFTYWIALAHNLPNWTYAQINRLAAKIIIHSGSSLANFFQSGPKIWQQQYRLSTPQILELQNAIQDFTSLKMLATSLHSRQVQMVPVLSKEFPKLLRQRLTLKHSPTLFYAFGNLEIANRSAWTVIGTRAPSNAAMAFTRLVAEIAAHDQRAIVCGLAKGIDRIALDHVLNKGGCGIAILPQGLFKQASHIKVFSQALDEGRILFLSSFHPFEGFSGPNAIIRNRWICNLGEEIIVPESNTFGGTWQGASKALADKRNVYVRQPLSNERNGNLALIKLGAKPLKVGKLSETAEKLRLAQAQMKPA